MSQSSSNGLGEGIAGGGCGERTLAGGNRDVRVLADDGLGVRSLDGGVSLRAPAGGVSLRALGGGVGVRALGGGVGLRALGGGVGVRARALAGGEIETPSTRRFAAATRSAWALGRALPRDGGGLGSSNASFRTSSAWEAMWPSPPLSSSSASSSSDLGDPCSARHTSASTSGWTSSSTS